MDEAGNSVLRPGEETRFLIGRHGDNLLIPFQCELCHFRNIMSRNPARTLASDVEMMDFIRRANLDAFWSREPRTVNETRLNVVRLEEKVGCCFGI